MVHTPELVAPATELYVPEVHTVQADVPAASALYVPAAQAVQAGAPAGAALYAPTAQAVHTAEVDDCAALPYRPTTHAVQPDVPAANEL